jgi:hypothetical protein
MSTISCAPAGKIRRGMLFVALTLTASAALATTAAELTVASYDLTNGATTSPNTSVRDDTYVGGTGDPSVAYSALAGGKGDLVDGITSPLNWDSNPAPYVGWSQQVLASPVITFHFTQPYLVTQVTMYVNWQYSPGSVDFSTDGTTWTHVDYTLPLPIPNNALITLPNPYLTGDTIYMRLNDRADNSYPDHINRSADWIMIQEVTFYGGPPAVLDIDASNTATRYDPSTDGLMVMRYLFGLTGGSITDAAIGATATRNTPAAIGSYLGSILTALDVDGDGTADALTDGLLVLRYMFGLRGDPLIINAISSTATRTTAPDIEAYIAGLMP